MYQGLTKEESIKSYGYYFKIKYDPEFSYFISDPFKDNDINCFILGNSSSLREKYNTIEFNNISYNMEELNDLFYELELNKDGKLNYDDDYILSALFEYFNYTYDKKFDNNNYYYIYDHNIDFDRNETNIKINKEKISKYLRIFINDDLYSWFNGDYYTIEYYKDNKEIDNIGGFTSEKYAIEYAKKCIDNYVSEYEKTLDIIINETNQHPLISNESYLYCENLKLEQEKLLNDLITNIKTLDTEFINFDKLKQSKKYIYIQKKIYDKLEYKEVKELFDLVIDY